MKLNLTAAMALPPSGTAILKGIRPHTPYNNGVKGEVDGIRATVLRFSDLEPVDVIIRGGVAPLTAEEIEAQNTNADFIVVGFANFTGEATASFREAGTMRITGAATAINIVKKGDKNV